MSERLSVTPQNNRYNKHRLYEELASFPWLESSDSRGGGVVDSSNQSHLTEMGVSG